MKIREQTVYNELNKQKIYYNIPTERRNSNVRGLIIKTSNTNVFCILTNYYGQFNTVVYAYMFSIINDLDCNIYS